MREKERESMMEIKRERECVWVCDEDKRNREREIE